MARAWAAASPLAIWTPNSTAVPTGSAPSRSSAASVSPSSSSETRNGAPVVLADVVERDDVRMGERGYRARFQLETTAAVGILRVVGGQNLERDVAPQPRVAGAIHLAHSACTNRRDDLIRPEANTGGKTHGYLLGALAPRSGRAGGL